jgi:hypothetical protein
MGGGPDAGLVALDGVVNSSDTGRINDSTLRAAYHFDFIETLLPNKTISQYADPFTMKYMTFYDFKLILSPPQWPPFFLSYWPFNLVLRHSLPADRRCQCQVIVDCNAKPV